MKKSKEQISYIYCVFLQRLFHIPVLLGYCEALGTCAITQLVLQDHRAVTQEENKNSEAHCCVGTLNRMRDTLLPCF